ncbi:MAG TPA: DUF192 domain-containing protein [Syntrophorhabdaceae bacterium]|nr:DUF192 domain-containing protein [Syntrophorhabdaceae bacterium]
MSALVVTTCRAGSDMETTVIFSDGSGRELCRFNAERAVSPEEQSRGLMFRRHMDDRSGMLFVNREDGMRFFWMKNTYIPLDLVFIGAGGDVKHVHYGAKPLDETPISSVYPVMYILEVNAGAAKKCHIVRGTKMATAKKK